MTSLALSIVFAAAALGLAAIAAQHLALWTHLRKAPPVPRRTPPVSILKPLCGVDDGLEANLASFADLDYPRYEVVLGVRSRRDPAWSVASAAVRRWPDRFRIVIQRGEPGLNPKVNQLVTLSRVARHDVLVISDSNVRVERGYLAEIAALLEDDGIGLVTHPIAGIGETRLGSLMDHLHPIGCSGAATRLVRGGDDLRAGDGAPPGRTQPEGCMSSRPALSRGQPGGCTWARIRIASRRRSC